MADDPASSPAFPNRDGGPEALFGILFVAAAGLSIMASWPAEAGDSSTAFMWDGRPVHPKCVTLVTETIRPHIVDIRDCAPAGGSTWVESDGTIGFKVVEPGGAPGQEPYSKYRVLAYSRGVTLVSWGGSPHGAGNFSGLAGMTVQGNELHMVYSLKWGVGEQCWGGVADTEAKGRRVFFERYATPYDMIHLVPEGDAYDGSRDLGGPDTSCYGRARYEIDPATGRTRFIHLQLDPTPVSASPESADIPRCQRCFDELVQEYISKHRQILLEKDLPGFVRAFAERCDPSLSDPSKEIERQIREEEEKREKEDKGE